MGSVQRFVEKVFDAVVAITVSVLVVGLPFLSYPLAELCDECKDFMLEQLGITMGWFGIVPEDVIEAQVLDQRLITDDIVKSLMTQIALEHQDTQKGIIELISTKTSQVRQKLSSYYDYGANTHTNGLPTTNIHVPYVPLDTVIPLIETEYGSTITVISSHIAAPTKTEWCDYTLWQLYGFIPSTQYLTYTGNRYKVNTIDYNYTTNLYDVSIYREVVETTETTITITPYDATYDNKHTEIVVTLTAYEGTISTSTTTTDELIPIGTEVDSYTSVNVNLQYDPTVVSIPSYDPIRSFIVKLYIGTSDNYFQWVYQTGSGNTILDNTDTYITQLEMLPIVEIRNGTVNVNSDKLSAKYLENKEILDYIGLDIDMLTDTIMENPDIANVEDAYVYFGLEVGDTDPMVSKMLYHLWEYLYFDPTIKDQTGISSYVATIKEGSYNSSLIWSKQERNVVTGSIGPIGTYTNTIDVVSGISTATFRKQETEVEYVEYVITNLLATTYIDRNGLWGMVNKTLASGPIVIPLSKYFIDQLTPLEQMEVFAKSLRLSTYAISITHLEWYETPAFFELVKIVMTVLAIVIFIISYGNGAKLSVLLIEITMSIGATYAFRLLLSTTDNPWLKALYTVLYAVAMVYTTGANPEQMGFFTVDQLTSIVTEYYNTKMEDLSAALSMFNEKANLAFEQLNEKVQDMSNYIETGFVQQLTVMKPVQGYIEGADLNIYRAVGIQKDIYDLSIHKVYSNLYDYDKYYRIGVV